MTNPNAPIASTGLASAGMVPIGATIADAWYCVAGFYGPHPDRHDSAPDAVREALSMVRDRVESYESDRGHPPSLERFSIDLRWQIAYPDASKPITGTEVTIERWTFDSIAQAEAYLARTERLRAVR